VQCKHRDFANIIPGPKSWTAWQLGSRVTRVALWARRERVTNQPVLTSPGCSPLRADTAEASGRAAGDGADADAEGQGLVGARPPLDPAGERAATDLQLLEMNDKIEHCHIKQFEHPHSSQMWC